MTLWSEYVASKKKKKHHRGDYSSDSGSSSDGGGDDKVSPSSLVSAKKKEEIHKFHDEAKVLCVHHDDQSIFFCDLKLPLISDCDFDSMFCALDFPLDFDGVFFVDLELNDFVPIAYHREEASLQKEEEEKEPLSGCRRFR